MTPKTKTPFFNRLQGLAMVAALICYGAGMIYLLYYLSVAPQQSTDILTDIMLHWPFVLFAVLALFFTRLTLYAQNRNQYYARHEDNS